MDTPSQSREQSTVPVGIAGAAIVAAAALWQVEGRTTIMLPIFTFALLASYALPFRIVRRSTRYYCRVVLFISTAVIYRLHPPVSHSSYYVDPFVLNQYAEICMAEIVVRAWSRFSTGYNRSIVVFFAGIVLSVATDTFDENIARYYAPLFVLMLAFGIQSLRAPAPTAASRRARAGIAAGLAAVYAIGIVAYQALYTNQTAISEVLSRLLQGADITGSTAGLSEESHLGSMFGGSGSFDRVLRIRTTADVPYMRAFSMYNFHHGQWGPSARDRDRRFEPVSESQLLTSYDGIPAGVYRYASTRGLILAPLNAVSIGIEGSNHLRWAREDGGPIRVDSPGPDSYNLTIGDAERQGLMCLKPEGDYLADLKVVPNDIDSRVRLLASQITSHYSSPIRKARAIEAWLPAHHKYSQRIQVSNRDPLGEFLMSDKAAHCEFFASAAVVLLRCSGIPARYVIGYYAHEQDGADIVVRQRDAHAWAECWIDGQGWITIDATPASGRPEGESTSVPGWKRALENFQDWFAAARQNISAQNVARVCGVIVCLLLVFILIQKRYHFTWRRAARQAIMEYSAADASLKSMYTRFETICRKQSLVCPPNQTWQQHLKSIAAELAGERDPDVGLDGVRDALAFITLYDLARFGRNVSEDQYRLLASRLEALERHSGASAAEVKS